MPKTAYMRELLRGMSEPRTRTATVNTSQFPIVRSVETEKQIAKLITDNPESINIVAELRARKFYVTRVVTLSDGRLALMVRPSGWLNTGITGFWFAEYSNGMLRFDVRPTYEGNMIGENERATELPQLRAYAKTLEKK